jgi:hypothetical protein
LARTLSGRIDRWWIWLAANLIGICLFLGVAARTWTESELVNEPGVSTGGASMVWGFSALPILAAFFVAHVALGTVADRQRQRSGNWRGEIFVLCTLLGWIAAFVFDMAHH